jgi:hypothetical protein
MSDATYLPKPSQGQNKIDPTLTIDTFIAEVPIDPHRSILVYLRQHGGRQYVRWRVFHRHRKHAHWYPDKRRAFVVPLGSAAALGHAIIAAVSGEPVTTKPGWLARLDEHRETLLGKLLDLNAPDEYLKREEHRRVRAWGLGPGPLQSLWRSKKSRRRRTDRTNDL